MWESKTAFGLIKKDHELLLNMVRMWTKNGLCTKTRKEKQNVQKEKKIPTPLPDNHHLLCVPLGSPFLLWNHPYELLTRCFHPVEFNKVVNNGGFMNLLKVNLGMLSLLATSCTHGGVAVDEKDRRENEGRKGERK